mgnify:CR=1 FL=1
MKTTSFHLCCLFLISAVWATAQDQESIPPILEKAPLGTVWADFISANPGAVIMDFGPDSIPDAKPDPRKPGEGLVIKLSKPEGLILFNFVDSRLEAVILSRKSEGDYAQQLVDAAKRSFGGGETTSKIASVPGYDVHTWTKQDRIIQAIVPEGGKPGDVSLRIASLEYAKRLGIGTE